MASEQEVGNIVYTVQMDVAKLISEQQKVNDRLDKMNSQFEKTGKTVDNTSKSFASLTKIAGALTAALSVSAVAQYADAWTSLNNKLANSVRAGESLVGVTERVFNITQATRSSLDATASLYARLERATREYGTSAGDLAKLTTIINQGFVVSGATAQEAENAIIQLSQGLASGALRGEEFNSVNEQGNRLIVALADSLGVTTGEMRSLAAQGKLTTDVVVNGLLSQGNKIGSEFAQTTTTISQALQVAGNNITKFFGESSSVKTGVSIFNDVVITLSQNIDVLSGALTIAAGVMGSRYVGALYLATKAKVTDAAATVNQQVQEYKAAKAVMASAQSEIANAQAIKASEQAKARALATQSAVNRQLGLNVSYQQEYAAIQSKIIAADNAEAAAKTRLAAATTQASVATRTYASAVSLAKGALGLVGGPAGAAMLAGAAIFYYYQQAQQAKQESIAFADSLDAVISKMKEMNSTQLGAEIAKAEISIINQKDAIVDLQAEMDNLQQKKAFIEQAANIRGAESVAEDYASIQRDIDIQAGKVDAAETKLSQTISKTGILRAQLNGTLQSGIELLKRDGEEAGIAAGMMNHLGNSLDFASRAKDKFNSSSIQIPVSKEADKFNSQLEQQNELLSITDKRLRAVTKARMEAESRGGNVNQVNTAGELAGKQYDLEKAESERGQTTKNTAKAESQAEQAEKKRVKTLQDLSNEIEVAALKSKGLNREAAQLAAVQELGAGATQAQIQAAKQQAGQIFDIQQQAADKKAAIDADSAAKAKQQRDLDNAQLDRQLKAGDVTFEQSQQRRAQIAADYSKAIANASSQAVVTPQQQLAGQVDPVQQLANENAQKLALIKEYTAQRVITEEQGLALMNTANTEYEAQRTAAQWQLLSQQGLGYDMLTSAVDAFAGNASNAITGLLTGTMSVSDAMRSLGSTILNSVINSLVQVGVEALKNFIVGQTMGTAATAASVGQAAVVASAWAPAAAMTSLATLGANSVPAAAAITSTVGLSSGLALAGMRKNGGPVSAGSMYRVGEGGAPELLQSGGKNYMIPGDGGKVISNADLQTGGGGNIQVSVVFNDYTSGSHSFDAQTSQDGNNLTIQAFITDMDQKGPMLSAIARNTTATPRASGG
ncbi:tape measure protein [Hafnia paralvei]|uniref:tape measure protein n=1 Tax=Hafnia paralvei TaxID=546367 RepID=UPI0029DDD11F|nr:tape measure protein [Hafnia paralvei]MDX6839745.1 tape measure protein [Hafnia paralvei]